MEKRTAQVSGSYLGKTPIKQFFGQITFEMRPDCIYYEWCIETEGGKWFRARPISRRVVPSDANPFEFTLEYAIEELRRYRSNRHVSFKVEQWSWHNSAG